MHRPLVDPHQRQGLALHLQAPGVVALEGVLHEAVGLQRLVAECRRRSGPCAADGHHLVAQLGGRYVELQSRRLALLW